MGDFIKGDIVVVPFPFSDLSSSKKRPAYVAAKLTGDDLILCQITSKLLKDEYSILIEDSHFSKGTLHQVSNVRPNRIFTADQAIVLYKVGSLNDEKIKEMTEKLMELFNA